jgi:hypothetical protein
MSLPFKYLKKEAPELYKILNGNRCYDERIPAIELLKTREGDPNLKLQTKNGNLTLHSNYSPQKESEKIYRQMGYKPRKLTVVLGFGLGYHIDYFLEKHPGEELIVIEPTYAVLAHAIRQRDLSGFFKNPKTRLLISANAKELAEWLCGIYNFHRFNGVQFLELPSYQSFFQAEFDLIKKEFFRVFSKYVSNVVTVMESGSEYTENCMQNVRFFNKFPWAAELYGKFKDVPAIVISAGPSLYLHFELLRSIGDKAVLIAVDTAWPILKKQGITPHFVCTADPTSANFMHLKGEDLSDTWLIVEPMTYYKTLELPKVRAFIANFEGYYSGYFARFSKNPAKLLSWGSIASTCFDLARKISAEPIIFVGQDLSYSDLLTHCPGSRFDELFYQNIKNNPQLYLYTSYMSYHANRIHDKPLKPVKDIYGKTVFTQHNLTVYANWFQDQFSQTGQKIINASERGILRENCEIAKFSDTVEKYINQEKAVSERIATIYRNRQPYDFKNLKSDLQKKLEILKKSDEIARKKQHKCHELLGLKNNCTTLREKESILTTFNELGKASECDILDKDIFSWIEHENQKADMYFKRQVARHMGKELDPELIEETANLYYNLYESKICTYKKLAEYLSVAMNGCESADL